MLIGVLTILFLLTLLMLPAVARRSSDARGAAEDLRRQPSGNGDGADAEHENVLKKSLASDPENDPDFARQARDFKRDGRLTLPAINFRPNEARIDHPSAALRRHLRLVVDHLEDAGAATLLVSGHTDRQGSRDHNLRLSLERARAVCDLLTAGYGVPAEILRATGRGYSDPVADNASAEGRQRNRRVEIQLESRPATEARLNPPAR